MMRNITKDKHFVVGRAIKNLKIRYLFDRAMNIESFVQQEPRNTTFACSALNTAEDTKAVNSRRYGTLC